MAEDTRLGTEKTRLRTLTVRRARIGGERLRLGIRLAQAMDIEAQVQPLDSRARFEADNRLGVRGRRE